MKKLLNILVLFFCIYIPLSAQNETPAEFTWGNAFYYNLDVGETVVFEGKEIELISIRNQLNQIRIGSDTVQIKMSRRTLPAHAGNIQFFVAGNKNDKVLFSGFHGFDLVKKDAFVCVSYLVKPLLDPKRFVFPVSFNDGFVWNMDEDSYLFSLQQDLDGAQKRFWPNPGIDVDLQDARGQEKHWLLAIENSKVVWIKDKGIDKDEKETCVLLESESQPGIYYLYEHLFRRNLEVRTGQVLNRGELISTAWGDENWGHLHFAVIKSDTVPQYADRFANIVNFFPQLYELYYGKTFGFPKSFTKGSILFAQPVWINRNEKNLAEYEEYLGKGWIFDFPNFAGKMESVTVGDRGNARCSKTIFAETPLACTNPENFYTYEISVPNGVYRIRAKVGDLQQPSWQKISFENVMAGTFSLNAGELVWTGEKAVKITDKKLTIRIFVDEENLKVAGISEIVFQRAN